MTVSTRGGIGWGWMLAYGIIGLLVGIFAIMMPISATFAVTIVLGVSLLVGGLFSLLAGIFGKGHEGRVYAILGGLVSLIGGGVMIFQPVVGAISLTLLVVAWLVVRGVMELAWGFRFHRRRWLMIALGVINLLFAAYIMYLGPLAALTLPGILLGFSFLFSGLTWTMFALDHRGESLRLGE